MRFFNIRIGDFKIKMGKPPKYSKIKKIKKNAMKALIKQQPFCITGSLFKYNDTSVNLKLFPAQLSKSIIN